MNDADFLLAREWHHRLLDLSAEDRMQALRDSGLPADLLRLVEELLQVDPSSEPEVRELDEERSGTLALLAISPQPTLPPGRILCHRYEIEREIGTGGFSVVYLAQDRRLDRRRVVLKLLPAQLLQHPRLLDHYRGEVAALSQLHHPSLITILDTDLSPDPGPIIVLEYIEGITLRDFLNRHRRAAPEMTVAFLRQIAGALEVAHAQNIWHLDLKPENILIEHPESETPRIVVIDFGIAQLRSEVLAEAGSAFPAGSPSYMAPEQFAGRPSRQSDIYALAVVAHELLTERRPSPSAREMAAGDPPSWSPSGHNEAAKDNRPTETRYIRMETLSVIHRALSADPAQRPASAAEFVTELQQSLLPPERTVRQTTVGLATWVALVVLSTLVVVGSWLWQRHRAANLDAELKQQWQILAQASSISTDTPDAPKASLEIFDRVIDRVRIILQESGPVEAGLFTLATAHYEKGGVLGHPGALHLGQSALALKEFRSAVEAGDLLLRHFPNSSLSGIVASETRDGLATLLIETGQWEEAEQVIREGIQINRKAQEQHPEQPRLLTVYANTIAVLSRITAHRGDWQETTTLRNESVDVRRRLFEFNRGPGDWGYRLDYAGALSLRGYLHRDLGNWEQSLADYALSDQVLEQGIAQSPDNYRLRFWLARNHLEEGKTLLLTERFAEAEQRLELATKEFRTFTRYQNPEAAAFRYLALALSHLAVAKRWNGAPAAVCDSLHREAQTRIEAASRADPASAEARHDATVIRENRFR